MYNIYGQYGGLKATAAEAEWRYYKPDGAPPLKLARRPIVHPDGTPAYCGESLKFHTGHWTVPKSKSQLFPTMAKQFYTMLYMTLTQNAPLEITPEQVRMQIAVIEECHRQNPQIRRRKRR